MASSSSYLFLLFVSATLSLINPVFSRPIKSSSSKPDPSNAAASARWLVSQNTWGVMSTLSTDLQGAPFGNVVSYSDGVGSNGRGIPYFYLTKLDPTPRDAMKDPRVSFTVSEVPIGTCGKLDPENPTCAKLTFNGKFKLVDDKSPEADFASKALFSKHPEMKGWPKNHQFQIYKLDIEKIFMINYFGGPKPLTPQHYLQYKP